MLNPRVSRSSSNNRKLVPLSPLNPDFNSINRSTENQLTTHSSDKLYREKYDLVNINHGNKGLYQQLIVPKLEKLGTSGTLRIAYEMPQRIIGFDIPNKTD